MILAGDSNEILRISEKFNGRSINFNRSNKFLDCINYCNFLDFGFKGSRYMWPNKRLYGNTILERLDRCLVNYDWNVLLLDSVVIHLPRTHSNHRLLLITLNKNLTPSTKSFNFETIWASHTDLRPMISNLWANHTEFFTRHWLLH